MNAIELRSKKDSGPYDSSLENNFAMYDNLPYIRDISICDKEQLGLMSGNIIKFYQYKFIEETRIIEYDKSQKKLMQV